MITLKDFKTIYPFCPYCGNKDFINKPSRPETITCQTCWSGDFGCQFWFKNGSDDAPFIGFRLWNGTHEAWFYVKIAGNFQVLIVDQGPICDNPVEDRLRMIIHETTVGMDKLLNRSYALKWLNTKTSKIIKGGNKLVPRNRL